nr:macrophage migration inhibitory factor homolog [Ipomoea batatas]
MEMENDVDWLAGKIEVEPDCEEDNTDVVDGILIVKLSQALRKELNVHGISLDVWSLLTWVVVVVLPVLNLRRTANTCSWMDLRNFSTITPKMPTLSLFTNVSVNAVVASDILKDATEAVAKIIGKPESTCSIRAPYRSRSVFQRLGRPTTTSEMLLFVGRGLTSPGLIRSFYPVAEIGVGNRASAGRRVAEPTPTAPHRSFGGRRDTARPAMDIDHFPQDY